MNNKITFLAYPIMTFALGGALAGAVAQEQLPREQALKYAYAASLNLEQLQGTPIPTDVDVKRAVVLADGEYGGMFLPEAKLSADSLDKAGNKVSSLGQLWLHRLTPMRDGDAVAADKLRMAKVVDEAGAEVSVPQCALGLRRTASGTLELLLYGKTTEPLLAVPVSPAGNKAEPGLAFEVERDSYGGQLTVIFFGKYKAKLSFTELEV